MSPAESPPPRKSKRRLFWIVGGIVLCVLVLLAGVLAIPVAHLLGRIRDYEAQRRTFIQRVLVAQERFKQEDPDGDGRPDFGSLEELRRAHLLKIQDLPGVGIVRVEPATADPENRWWACAEAPHPLQGDSFFVNHTGVLYRAPEPIQSRIDPDTARVPEGMVVDEK